MKVIAKIWKNASNHVFFIKLIFKRDISGFHLWINLIFLILNQKCQHGYVNAFKSWERFHYNLNLLEIVPCLICLHNIFAAHTYHEKHAKRNKNFICFLDWGSKIHWQRIILRTQLILGKLSYIPQNFVKNLVKKHQMSPISLKKCKFAESQNLGV